MNINIIHSCINYYCFIIIIMLLKYLNVCYIEFLLNFYDPLQIHSDYLIPIKVSNEYGLLKNPNYVFFFS